jgi:hypothetical protein
MFEHGLYRHPIGGTPDQFPFTRAFSHAHPELDLLMSKVTHQPAQRPQVFKFTEEEPDDLLHLLIRVELNFSCGAPDVADWQGKLQFAPLSFAQTTLVHALLQDMEFCFGHRSLDYVSSKSNTLDQQEDLIEAYPLAGPLLRFLVTDRHLFSEQELAAGLHKEPVVLSITLYTAAHPLTVEPDFQDAS